MLHTDRYTDESIIKYVNLLPANAVLPFLQEHIEVLAQIKSPDIIVDLILAAADKTLIKLPDRWTLEEAKGMSQSNDANLSQLISFFKPQLSSLLTLDSLLKLLDNLTKIVRSKERSGSFSFERDKIVCDLIELALHTIPDTKALIKVLHTISAIYRYKYINDVENYWTAHADHESQTVNNDLINAKYSADDIKEIADLLLNPDFRQFIKGHIEAIAKLKSDDLIVALQHVAALDRITCIDELNKYWHIEDDNSSNSESSDLRIDQYSEDTIIAKMKLLPVVHILRFLQSHAMILSKSNASDKIVDMIAYTLDRLIIPNVDELNSTFNPMNPGQTLEKLFDQYIQLLNEIMKIFEPNIKFKFKIGDVVKLLSLMDNESKNPISQFKKVMLKALIAASCTPAIRNSDDLAKVLPFLEEDVRPASIKNQDEYWNKIHFKERCIAFLIGSRSSGASNHFFLQKCGPDIKKLILYKAGLITKNPQITQAVQQTVKRP